MEVTDESQNTLYVLHIHAEKPVGWPTLSYKETAKE
jgi:hypothetical protein